MMQALREAKAMNERLILSIDSQLSDVTATLNEILVKQECIQRQLNAMEVKQNLKQLDNKTDIYFAAVLIGAVAFLALRVVPV
jgi:hypoxanthine-guanine phosphoribosyltransferase